MEGSAAFMVTVTNLTPRLYSLSAASGRASPLVEMHRVSSGNSRDTSSSVRNVSSLARGSPGPAMPMTLRLGTASFTTLIFSMACPGVRTSLVTPGRDSLQQSNFLLQ